MNMPIIFSHFFLDMASALLLVTLMVNLFCFFRRVGMGDKVLCLDLLTMQLLNGIALIAFSSRQVIYIDVMILLVCTVVLASSALAYYLSGDHHAH